MRPPTPSRRTNADSAFHKGHRLTRFTDRFFIVDKAPGPSSFDVVRMFRRATGERKVGHTGTLDPLARGLLILCTGRATRAVEQFMNLEQTYEFDVRLGLETDTGDAEGEVVRETGCPPVGLEDVEAAAAGFVGSYRMKPPVYSALKRDGRRLYEMARAGESPEVERRTVEIHAFDIIGMELPGISCRVRCSRGTYVRSLAVDLGERLGAAAHISRLERTAVGPFSLDGAIPSQCLAEGDVDDLEGIGLAEALSFLPGVVLSKRSSRALFSGTLPEAGDAVRVIGAPGEDTSLRMLDESGTLLAVGLRRAGRERDRLKLVDSFRLYVDPSFRESI